MDGLCIELFFKHIDSSGCAVVPPYMTAVFFTGIGPSVQIHCIFFKKTTAAKASFFPPSIRTPVVCIFLFHSVCRRLFDQGL